MKIYPSPLHIILSIFVILLIFIANKAYAENLKTGVVFLDPMAASPQVQDQMLARMREDGVHLIRTQLKPSDDYIDFAKRAMAEGIKIDAVIDIQYQPTSMSNQHQAPPLSLADPSLSAAYFQTLLQKLEAKNIVLAAFEIGDELNLSPSNGDFSSPGSGKIIAPKEFEHSDEGQRVAKGFLQYLKVLSALKNIRDHSLLNRETPIVLGGLANNGPARVIQNSQMDGVSINGTIEFMRAHGLDKLVDIYGIHYFPSDDTASQRKSNLENNAVAECRVDKEHGKPCWITEWGLRNMDAHCPTNDFGRAATVAETMNNYRTLAKERRVLVALYYTWNSDPGKNKLEPMSIFRCGTLTEAGILAVATQ